MGSEETLCVITTAHPLETDYIDLHGIHITASCLWKFIISVVSHLNFCFTPQDISGDRIIHPMNNIPAWMRVLNF